MVDDRKAALLRAVVSVYIRTAQPVGSSALAQQAGLNISSATVRNELASLERDGYLAQPHTSAGRIPTQAGYRFYVDSVMSDTSPSLPAQSAAEITSFFSHAYNELDEMMRETTKLLSRVTQCAAVVIEPPRTEATVRAVQFVNISGTTYLLIVVLSDGSVEKHAIECAQPVSDQQASVIAAFLDRALVGSTVASTRAVPAVGDPDTDRILASCVTALRNESPELERAFVGGASEIVSQFEAVETARAVLSALEQQYLVVSLLRDVLSRGDTISIGTEHGVEPLSECSVVVAPFSGEGTAVGTIGILGPTRMDYATALAATTRISEDLSRRVAEG